LGGSFHIFPLHFVLVFGASSQSDKWLYSNRVMFFGFSILFCRRTSQEQFSDSSFYYYAVQIKQKFDDILRSLLVSLLFRARNVDRVPIRSKE
jgi:hypothetical protein